MNGTNLWTRTRSAALCLCFAGGAWAQPEVSVGLDELIRRVLDRDLEIEALRGRVAVSEAEARTVNPLRNPEIRIGYSRTSRTPLEPAYTERVTETLRESGSRETRLDRTESESGGFDATRNYSDRNAGSTRTTVTGSDDEGVGFGGIDVEGVTGTVQGRETSSGSFNERYSGSESRTETFQRDRRVTRTREVTPTRTGRTIVERVTENTSESFNEDRAASGRSTRNERFNESRSESGSETETRNRVRNEAGGDGPTFENDTRTVSGTGTRERSGSETENESSRSSENRRGRSEEKVVSERVVEEERIGRDPNAGSEQFSGQIRLYPRHPWEMRARTREALAATSLAEFLVEGKAREVADRVRARYRDLQLVLLDIDVRGRELVEARDRYEAEKRRYDARLSNIDELSARRVDVLESEVELGAAQREFRQGRDDLSLLAGLSNPAAIDFADSIEDRWVELAGMDLDALADVAFSRHPTLGELARRSDLVRSRADLRDAARIPWFSLVAASYDYTERWGGKYRDEWGVTVGVEIPIQAWFGRERDVDRAALESFRKQGQLLRERLRLQLQRASDNLRAAADEMRRFQEKGEPLRRNLREEMARVPDDVPEADRIRRAVRKSLLEIDQLELELYREYATRVLEFESLVGTDLSDVFQPGEAVEEVEIPMEVDEEAAVGTPRGTDRPVRLNRGGRVRVGTPLNRVGPPEEPAVPPLERVPEAGSILVAPDSPGPDPGPSPDERGLDQPVRFGP